MREWFKKNFVLVALGVGFFLSLLVLNNSFRLTFARRRAIHDTKAELEKVDRELSHLKTELATIENPSAQENLVRRDLGYLRPGEKEVRFQKTSKKDE